MDRLAPTIDREYKGPFLDQENEDKFRKQWQAGFLVRQDCVEDILGLPIGQDELDAEDGPFLEIMKDDNPVNAYKNLLKLKSFLNRLVLAVEA